MNIYTVLDRFFNGLYIISALMALSSVFFGVRAFEFGLISFLIILIMETFLVYMLRGPL